MKVLLVNSRPNARTLPGGDTVQVDRIGAALRELGVEVDIHGLEVLNEALPSYDLAHVFNIQEPEPAQALHRALSRRGLPFVLSPIYWDMHPYWYSLASSRGKWRQVTRLLGESLAAWVYQWWQEWKERFQPGWRVQRRLLQMATRVQPNSLSETKMLRRTFRLPSSFEGKTDVIPNAVEADFARAGRGPAPDFLRGHALGQVVLQVGTIYPVKNQLGLLEALFDLPVTLVFVGPTMPAFADYGEACRQRASDRGRVVFVEGMPHDALAGVYGGAAVHALPSWRETPGLVSLEAAAAGCQVVSTSIGSARDYFGDLAWYCHPANRSSIRQAVEAALTAPPSDALQARVTRDYTWQKAAQVTLASYERALAG
jgi:glycosyltransferase involved in cell wall biosynthesis